MSPEVYAIIISPIVALFVGVALNRFLEDRPRLVTFISNTFGITIAPPEGGGNTYRVHSHSITIRNTGRRAAQNVRIGHNILPNFQVLPLGSQYTVATSPDGKKEIVFQSLVPREQVIINYLYYPPLTWTDINTVEKFDSGFAKRLPVLLTRQYSKLFNYFAVVMFLIGIATVVYWIVRLIAAIAK